jgi:vancomycin permeability regulator SanA
MKKFVRYSLFFFLIWLVTHSIFISIDGLSDNFATSDVAVVLGNKVNKDGKPSERLKARLDVAVNLFNDSLVRFIVVSGGVGSEGFDEALVMKNYLIRKGVMDGFIIVDNQGYNTFLTASNFVEINETYHFESLVLVSQFFHLSRTKLIFRKFGFKKLSTAHAKYFEWRDIYSLLREFPAYYKYLFKFG